MLGEDLHALTLGQQRGVIVGDDRILYTSDGGDSWALAPVGSVALRGVADDGESMWAVGLGGAMLRSDDAGASWVEIESPTQADLWAIGDAGIDAEAGLFAIGDAGTILRHESSDWVAIDHDLDGDLRGLGGNFMVGREGLAIELEEGSAAALPGARSRSRAR